MYSGYVVPFALRNETSATIAKAIEQNIIKPFGVPAEISSDNAANLNGPEVVKLCKFYEINRRLTIAYSLESHGLVEVCNKLLVQLMRIFNDQFKTGWVYVLTLTAVMMNSLPRPSLQEKSLFYLMFNEDPGTQISNSAEMLDMNEYIQQSTNNKNFAKLVREFLVQFRKQRNRLLKRRCRSFPPGSLIYVQIQSLQDASRPYRLVERTLLCQEKVFIPLLVENGFLTDLEQSLLAHFFAMVKTHEGVVADVIVYLRTSQGIALTRIQKRNRQGEEDLSLDYLTKLHSYYDEWLLGLDNVVVVNADDFDNVIPEVINQQVLNIMK